MNERESAEALYLHGADLAQRGSYEEAVREMAAALERAPHLHTARLQLGLLHLTLARANAAREAWGPLEALDDRDSRKHFKRGLEALIVDDLPACVAALETGMRLNNDNPALNRDMQLIIDKVHAVQRDEAARTDFSLYDLQRK